MKFILWIALCLSVRAASWQDNFQFYWFNSSTPAVAITSSNIVNVEHQTGSVTGVQIGDPSGPTPASCTGLVSLGICGGTEQNCHWTRRYKNETNDVYIYQTCRPITSGIAYVVTNDTVGMAIVWYSAARHQWFNGNILSHDSPQDYTFADGMHVVSGMIIFSSTTAIGGDSGSPVFNMVGDLVGVVSATAGADNVALFMWPDGVSTRPSSAATHLAFGVQPSNTTVGLTITPAVTVQVLDSGNNVVTSDNSTKVTLTIETNPGGGTLTGGGQTTVSSGVVTFSGLSINLTSNGYTLAATDTTGGGGIHPLTGVTSSVFNITAVPPPVTTTGGVAGLSALFNSDPDR